MKTFIIAEIGWNHMGNMTLAKEMISAAKESGADYAKFQTWSVKNLVAGPWDNDGRKEIYVKAELSKEMHEELYDYCNSININFLTSIFNFDDYFKIKNLKLKTMKIPSHEIHNLDLIKKVSEVCDELLVSAGAAKWDEILNITKLNEFQKITLMHCVSSYPCHFNDLNFNKYNELQLLSEKKIGYSGHYQGTMDAEIAITLRSSYIEKHFTIDNKLPGRDNQFAILPDQLKKIVNFKNEFKKMMDNDELEVHEKENDIVNKYRGRWGGKI